MVHYVFPQNIRCAAAFSIIFCEENPVIAESFKPLFFSLSTLSSAWNSSAALSNSSISERGGGGEEEEVALDGRVPQGAHRVINVFNLTV